MKEFQYTIQDPMGFHARPAGALVRAAKAYASKVTISCGEKSAQLTRLMAVMGLGIKQGQTVTVTIGSAANGSVLSTNATLSLSDGTALGLSYTYNATGTLWN